MKHKIDYLGTLYSLHGDEPRRAAALLGCSLGLAGRRAPLDKTTSFELHPFLLYFLGIDKMRLGPTAHLILSLSAQDRTRGAAAIQELARDARVSGLAGVAYAVAGGTPEQVSTTLREAAEAFDLGEDDIIAAARLLQAAGHAFSVVDPACAPANGHDRALFREEGRDVLITWKAAEFTRELVTSYYPFGDEHMTPGALRPVDAPLEALRERYPWPDVCPNNPFDRRGWFGEPHMTAFLRFLPKKPSLILEIGSFLGASLRFMMEIRPGSFFIAVDPFGIMQQHETGIKVYDFRSCFYTNCWNYRDRLIAVTRDSADALPELGELGVRPDVAYIDGLHNYAAVSRDARLSLALNPDALLIGDDYSDPESVKCGLRTAVAEIAQETGRSLEVVGDHVWVLPPRA